MVKRMPNDENCIFMWMWHTIGMIVQCSSASNQTKLPIEKINSTDSFIEFYWNCDFFSLKKKTKHIWISGKDKGHFFEIE